MELNKLVGALLVGLLIFMVINVAVDEIWKEEEPTGPAIYPTPAESAGHGTAEETEAAQAEPEAEATDEKAAAGDIIALIADADVEAGKKIARKCKACHTIAAGGANRVGPNLWGVVGRKMASHEGYSYSSALSEKGGTWSFENLNAFLTRPKDFVPGTKMSFAGLKSETDRAAVIAYLRSMSDNPAPLPK